LERAGVEIETARKTVQMLYEQLGNDTAKETARMFLLTLFDMVSLQRQTSGITEEQR
jgi:hypothetical protein